MQLILLYLRHLLIGDLQHIGVSVRPAGPILDMLEPGTVAH